MAGGHGPWCALGRGRASGFFLGTTLFPGLFFFVSCFHALGQKVRVHLGPREKKVKPLDALAFLGSRQFLGGLNMGGGEWMVGAK